MRIENYEKIEKMRIVRSIADDLVSNRSIVTLKHRLRTLGLHGMAGQKQSILLLSLYLMTPLEK